MYQKLTPDDCRVIRTIITEVGGRAINKVVAAEFGVCPSTITRVLKGSYTQHPYLTRERAWK